MTRKYNICIWNAVCILMLILIHFQDVTHNENWNNCLDINGQSLARCIYNCKNGESCETDCVGRFKLKTDDCPCEVNSAIDQGSSGRQRPRRPGSLKPSLSPLKSTQMSLFSSMPFVVGELTYEIQNRTPRTVKRNSSLRRPAVNGLTMNKRCQW